jgi:capsid protein
VSKFVTFLPTIDQLDRYGQAELDAALERAKAGNYWRTTLYDDLKKIIKATQDESVRREQISELIKRIKAQGIMKDGLTPIPREDEIVTIGNNGETVYNAITENSKENIASAMGLSSQIVYQDSSQSNYSSIKAMMAFAGIRWAIRFDEMEAHIINPIMENVIKAGVLSGALKLPGYGKTPRMYHVFEYMRVTEVDIEPAKTAQANKTNIANGTHSLREIARKRGRNIEDIFQEKIEDEILEQRMRQEMYAEAGIPLPEANDGEQTTN